jgi:hypothetical protein
MADLVKDKSSSRVPELNKNNWLEWSDLLNDILESKDLLEVTESAILEGASDSAKTEYKKKDAKARALIKTAVGPAYRVHVLGITTASECLNKLKAVCQTTSEERVQTLLTEFFGLRYKTSIDTTATKLTTIQNQVKALSKDEAPSDSIKKTILLKSLGEEYKSTVFALKASGISKLSFDDIVNRLKETEYGLEESEEVLARAADTRSPPDRSKESKGSKGSKGSKDSKKNKKCHFCKKPGHFIAECRAKQAKEKEEEEGNKDNKARTATAEAWTVISTTPSKEKDTKSPDWILDSGCSQHITYDKTKFVSLEEQDGVVTVANRKELSIYGKGTIEIELSTKVVSLSNVLYVPDIGYNLLSISQLADNDITTTFFKGKSEIRRNGSLLATSYRQGRSYVLKETIATRLATTDLGKPSAESILWHRRLGHPGNDKLVITPKGLSGLPTLIPLSEECDTCERTKAIRRQNRQPAERATRPLERVYIDFWGPYKFKTIAGNRYLLTITDDYSRKGWVFLAKARDEVYSRIREWKPLAERESKSSLKAIRIDNAKEFLKLKDLECLEGVRIEPTTPYTPEQNGVAERQNRTLTTLARSLLGAAKLPKDLWGEAIVTACYLRNRTPRKNEKKTPEELFTGTKPSGQHLRVFGCLAYTFIPKEKRDKLDDTVYSGVFVGYSESTKQYRILNPRTKAIKLATSVRFFEDKRGGDIFYPTTTDPTERVPIETIPIKDEETEFDLDIEEDEYLEEESDRTNDGTRREPSIPLDEDDDDTIVVRPRRTTTNATDEDEANREPTEPSTTRYPTRERRIPSRYALEANKVDYSPKKEVVTPKTYEEAIKSNESREWKLAIDGEVSSLLTNTLEIVRRPRKPIKLVGAKWLFKLKTLPTGQIDKYKARVVGKGYSQTYGVDYFETFSPVVRLESLLILLAIAAIRGLVLHQMDVVTAYLEGPLDEEVYLEPFEGLDIGEGNVIRLKRGLYGLK